MSLLEPSRFQEEQFSKGLKTSAAAHAVLAIIAIVISVAMPREPVKIIQSMRVDLVGLPDIKKSDLNKVTPDDLNDLSKRLNEMKKPKVVAPVEEEATKDDSMALKKEKEKEKPKKDDRKSALKSAIDRIKALEAIENDVRKQKVAAKGNNLSKGNALTGDTATTVNEYAARMASKLRDNWNLPIWLSRQKLSAKIVIFIDRAGYVSNTVVAQSSGNKQFDDYCLKTIRMAQPFGAPPEEILDGGITLGFPL